MAAIRDKEAFAKVNIFGLGEPNSQFAQYFTGNSYLNIMTLEGVPVMNVTFEPGCINHWHIHAADEGGGQIICCTAGEGWYQEWGKEAVKMTPGVTVSIPPNVKHWHGAAKDSWFAHVAIEVPGKNTHPDWLEPVAQEDYDNLPAFTPPADEER